MEKLTIDEIISRIKNGVLFEAVAIDDSFKIKINRYVPFCCVAIHNGANLRSDLKAKCSLDDYHRWYEEDPHTGQFIDSLPITLIGQDSRYEYDLNRKPSECIYEEAWGEKVWKKNLNKRDRQLSLRKHEQFYRVVKTLMAKLTEQFESCVVYDIHSYNHKRWERKVPLFNIGTEALDKDHFENDIQQWKKELEAIEIKDVENQTAINDVFKGKGYFLEFVTTHFSQVLVLATEIKKIYCDENSGEIYPARIHMLMQGLKNAILRHATYYIERQTNWTKKTAAHLLGHKEDKALLKVDRRLFQLLKSFELLAVVNPINSGSEYVRFAKNKFTEAPRFRYSPIKIAPFELKIQLNALPTSQIADVSIRNLYEAVINSFFDKIDLLATLNTNKFLYNSLRYFGRPGKSDLHHAEYIMHLPPIPSEPRKAPTLPISDVIEIFESGMENYGFKCSIELSKKVISQVLVLNSTKTILIRPDARFTKKEAYALLEHEIGVHMLTTQNSSEQKLKVFNLGLPVNTMTQEGLATLSEYLSGNITLKRLKKLALRVIITDMMCNGASFMDCYHHLVDRYALNSNDAYTIVTRIFRGGGFTKDHLYMRGFIKLLNFWKNNHDIEPLLVGKTSLEYYDTIKEMIDRELIKKPDFITHSLLHPALENNDPVYHYIVSGLK